MKRRCKKIDITDKEFILRAIRDCMSKKGRKAGKRRDVQKLFAKAEWNEERLAEMLQEELRSGHIDLEPVRYKLRVDHSNGKLRIIAVEGIKQQIYDYLAFNALKELDTSIGHYQIACRDDMGPLFGAKVIHQWIKDPKIRHAVKADNRKCYPSITHERMDARLRKSVGNEKLLWLIHTLLKHVESGKISEELKKAMEENQKIAEDFERARKGLPVGSVLSIKLCALYLSDLYHRLEGTYFTTRRGKRENAVKHVMINLDDIYIFGANAKALHKVMSDLIRFAAEKGLEIKKDWQIIDLNPKGKDAHIDVLGYRVYRDRITMRHRDYVKTKRAVRNFKLRPMPAQARSLCSYIGLFVKHINSVRFCRKYGVYRLFTRARKVISSNDKSKIFERAADRVGGKKRGRKLVYALP